MGKLVSLVAQPPVQIVRAPKTSPRQTDPIVGYAQGGQSAIGPAWRGKVGKSNVDLFRHWSRHSEWIRGCVFIRRSQISAAEWDIVPLDKTQSYSKRLQKQIRERLQSPNAAGDSFRTLIEPIIEDLLVLDAGVIEKERNLLGEITGLWAVNGGDVRVNALWDGSDPNEYRYFWYPDYKERARFVNDDLVYIMQNRRTDSPLGLSPLETLKLTIEAELYGHEYNRRQVTGAAPDGVMDLGRGATGEDIRRFRSYFESEIAGRGAVGFIGGTENAKWIPFRNTNRDMQFLEWQIYLVRKIAVIFGLTPQDLGITYDVNRSTSEMQVQISEDRGLRPLMSLLQDHLTSEVVWDKSFGGRANNLAFRFTALNLKETTAKANINHIALSGVPWKSINEARIEDGRQPLGTQYDKLIMSTPQGAVTIDEVLSAAQAMSQSMGQSKGSSEGGK